MQNSQQKDISVQEGSLSKEEVFEERKKYYLKKLGIGKKYWDTYKVNIKEIDDYIENLKTNIQNGIGLVLSGKFGVGKTTILSRIAQKAFDIGRFEKIKDKVNKNEEHIIGYNPLYTVNYILVSKLTDLFFNNDVGFKGKLKCLVNVDLLLLDDFGWEHDSDFIVSKLVQFFEERYANNRATCVATNLKSDQLKDSAKYAHIIDRFRDENNYISVGIAGESKRKK